MRCNRCLNDETVRGISFDSSGVCNFCHNFDEIKEKLADENMLHQLTGRCGAGKAPVRCRIGNLRWKRQ